MALATNDGNQSFEPLHDGILVMPKTTEKSPGGLHLPDNAVQRRSMTEGFVLAVGPGMFIPATGKIHDHGVKEGDYVILPEHAGQRVELFGSKLLLIRASEILGKIVTIKPKVEQSETCDVVTN